MQAGRLRCRHAADDVAPSFSADGSKIAFQSGRSGGGIYIIPTLGGEERLLVERGFSPRFSPDGTPVAYGVAEPLGSQLYVAPAAGGPPVRTDARSVLLREGFQAFHGLPTPDGWVGTGSRIVFHAQVGDSSNMWQVAIAPKTWQVSEAPQRVTLGTTDEGAASVTATGRMVFSSRTISADIWSLPIEGMDRRD